MADILTPEQRSKRMRRIRSANTGPEMALRRALFSCGLRYRLHRKDLPGKPDLVFPRTRVALFVHGCFWHQHAACRNGKLPTSRTDYWIPKLQRNVERDREAQMQLRQLGWAIVVVWECQIKSDLPLVVSKVVATIDLSQGLRQDTEH